MIDVCTSTVLKVARMVLVHVLVDLDSGPGCGGIHLGSGFKADYWLTDGFLPAIFCRRQDQIRGSWPGNLVLDILQKAVNYLEDELLDVPGTADFYDKTAETQSLQEKVKQCLALKASLEWKIDEVESAAVMISSAMRSESMWEYTDSAGHFRAAC